MTAEQELSHQGSTVEYGLLSSRVSSSMDEEIEYLQRMDEVSTCCSVPASSTDSKHDGNSSIDNLALKCSHGVVYVGGVP